MSIKITFDVVKTLYQGIWLARQVQRTFYYLDGMLAGRAGTVFFSQTQSQ